MGTFAALLRAVNVGGTGVLPMADLRALCERAGLAGARTYIQTGNVVFTSALSEARVKAVLERALAARLGKPVGVLVRTEAELARALEANPFPRAPPNKVAVFFLDEPPPRKDLAALVAPGGEEVAARGREVFVHYPLGQGKSRLRLPFAGRATARNLNTVARLAEMAAG